MKERNNERERHFNAEGLGGWFRLQEKRSQPRHFLDTVTF